MASSMAIAAAASTHTTARGTMQQSCLPPILIISSVFVFRFTVCWGLEIEGVGLKATLAVDFHAVGDAAVDAAASVGGGYYLSVALEAEWVVGLAAF